MDKLILRTCTVALIAACLVVSCSSSGVKKTESPELAETAGQIPANRKPPEISFTHLLKYNNKYPFDVHLFEDSLFITRLQKLIGKSNLSYLTENWQVETPIVVEGRRFVVSGCKAHECADTNFIIALDLEMNNLSAGIRKEGSTNTFTEKKPQDNAVTLWEKND